MSSIIFKPLFLISVWLLLLCGACGIGNERIRNRDKVLTEGAALYHKYACITCHSLEGEVIYGPPLNGLYMQKVEVIREGEILTLVADRDYIHRAISDPRFEEVKGYESKDMPEVLISEEEMKLLVDYLVLKQ
jgi:cytochrome c oxidase subunit 2